MKPVLSDEARDVIAESYAKLRIFEREQEDMARTQPITVRALETMIRLATAHAKGRMSRTVELEDAHAAIELVQFAYFKKIIEKPRKKKKVNSEDGDEEYDSGAESPGDEQVFSDEEEEEVIKKTKGRKTGDEEEGGDVLMEEDEPKKTIKKSSSQSPSLKKTQVTRVVEMDAASFKEFKGILNSFMKKSHSQTLNLEEFVSNVMSQNPNMDREEIEWALQKMQGNNQIMVTEGDIILI